MRNWLQTLWGRLRRRRYERGLARDAASDLRGQDHLDRQRTGIRDVPPPGAGF